MTDTPFNRAKSAVKWQEYAAIGAAGLYADLPPYQAVVEDGQTVVVGGVYEFKDQNSMSKVPFLGDIPILGNLFKNRNHTKSKAELLVFVTPKVIRVAQRPN